MKTTGSAVRGPSGCRSGCRSGWRGIAVRKRRGDTGVMQWRAEYLQMQVTRAGLFLGLWAVVVIGPRAVGVLGLRIIITIIITLENTITIVVIIVMSSSI